MSKSLSKYNYFGEFKALQNRVKSLSKITRIASKQKEVKSTLGKTSLEIDNEIIPQLEVSSEELDGAVISDPKNNLLLVRQNGLWRKIKTESL